MFLKSEIEHPISPESSGYNFTDIRGKAVGSPFSPMATLEKTLIVFA